MTRRRVRKVVKLVLMAVILTLEDHTETGHVLDWRKSALMVGKRTLSEHEDLSKGKKKVPAGRVDGRSSRD